MTVQNVFSSFSVSQAITEEVRALEPEVTRVTDDGNYLLRNENLNSNQKDQLVKDVHDIEERYEELKKDGNNEVMR